MNHPNTTFAPRLNSSLAAMRAVLVVATCLGRLFDRLGMERRQSRQPDSQRKKRTIRFITAIMLALLAAPTTVGNSPTSTAFTYQGRLTQAGEAYNGSASMTFTLFDAATGGSVVAGPLPLGGVNVSNGHFTVELDFGAAAFTNDARWLSVTVNGATLTPRQPITRAPYALQTRGLFVDESSRIGIGTLNPLVPLHVETGVISAVMGVSSNSFAGTGVLGNATAATGATSGVRGVSSSTSGRGVVGVNTSGAGETFGVWGESKSYEGVGVYGRADNLLADLVTTGVYGESNGEVGRGVFGHATHTTGVNRGVWGRTESSKGAGVLGEASGASGENYGVRGVSTSNQGRGVAGFATGSGVGVLGGSMSQNAHGVQGYNKSSSGTAFGGYFTSSSTEGVALHAQAEAGSGQTTSGRFHNFSTSGRAIEAVTFPSIGTSYGIYCHNGSPQGWSAYFTGIRSYFGTSVGIGLDNPSFQLHLSTNSAAKPTSNTWTISSDARLKKNITTIAHALDDLLALRGVTYQWIDPDSQGGMDGTYTGFIAQEVERVFPEWITEDASVGGYKHLTVIGFEGLVVEALRELREERDAEIALLRRENENLNARLDALTQLVERLATTQKEVLK